MEQAVAPQALGGNVPVGPKAPALPDVSRLPRVRLEKTMDRRRWTLLIVVASVIAASGARADDHPLHGLALVIGESDYTGLPRLTNPREDARGVADVLSQLGFEVTTVYDADARKLQKAESRFLEDASDADVALVYYSGHGVELAGSDYLIPTDADVSSPQSAGQKLLSVDDLLDELRRTVPVGIVLLDACRTSPFPAGATIVPPGGNAPLPVASAGLAVVRGPSPVAASGASPGDKSLGLVVGFAASPGQPALDGDPGGNSPYAGALIKHLGAGGYSFGDVMTMVSEEVYLKTRARQLPWTNSSVRRVLSFGGTSSNEDADDATITSGRRKLLLTIAELPDPERRQVETAAETAGVPMDALYGLLATLGANAPQNPEDLGKLLQTQTGRLKEIMKEQSALSETDPEIVRLSQLAQKALAEGALDANVQFWEAAKARYAEISKTLDVAEADLKARRLEGGEVFARTAEAYALKADYKSAAENYGIAYEQVARWDPAKALAYKWSEAGALETQGDLRGDNEALRNSIAAYQDALELAPRETNGRAWGFIHNDLSIALSMLAGRSGDPSYLEQSIAAVRAALDVTDRNRDPQAWAMAENNLGTQLNDYGLDKGDVTIIKQAIDAFNAALEVSTRESDPDNWAMIKSNLGTALDRVGRFGEDNSYYEQAIDAYRSALEIETRDRNPMGWADNQTNIALSLEQLGTIRNDVGLLQQAVDAIALSLQERKRELVPLEWAASQVSLGYALQLIGDRTHDQSAYDRAEAAYRAALEEYGPDRGARNWANARYSLGNLVYRRAIANNDLKLVAEAAEDFRDATTVWSDSDAPIMWAMAQTNLGSALADLAQTEQAIAAFKASERVYTQAAFPISWAEAENSAGWLTATLGYRNKDRTLLLEGKASIEASAQVYQRLGMELTPAMFGDRLKSIDDVLAHLD
jgi:uncharacterized caspase-like protein